MLIPHDLVVFPVSRLDFAGEVLGLSDAQSVVASGVELLARHTIVVQLHLNLIYNLPDLLLLLSRLRIGNELFPASCCKMQFPVWAGGGGAVEIGELFFQLQDFTLHI